MNNKNIVIIDDSYLFVENVIDYFELENINVFHTTNQNELYNVLNNNHIDMIIIDVFLNPQFLNLPRPVFPNEFSGVGFHLLKMIEKNLDYKPKVIFLTTLAEKEIINAGYSTDNYFQKPILLEDIFLCINNSCGRSCCPA